MAKIKIKKVDIECPLLINKANNQISLSLPKKQLLQLPFWEGIMNNLENQKVKYKLTLKIKSIEEVIGKDYSK